MNSELIRSSVIAKTSELNELLFTLGEEINDESNNKTENPLLECVLEINEAVTSVLKLALIPSSSPNNGFDADNVRGEYTIYEKWCMLTDDEV